MRLETGYVKFFDEIEGVGSIIMSEDGKEVFVNRKAIAAKEKFLLKGQQVEFTVHNGAKGLTANDVIAF